MTTTAPLAGAVRTEPRLVRPFFALRGLDEALDGARLRLFPDDPPADGPSIPLPPDRMGDVEPVVLLPSLEDVWQRLGKLGLRETVRLVVTGFRELPRLETVVATLPESEVARDEIHLPAQEVRLLFRGRRAELRVALCLDRDAAAAGPGLPRWKGHWIASKRFRVGTTEERRLFDVERVEEERWTQLGFPRETLFRIEKVGAIDEEDEEGKIAVLQLHASVYDKLFQRQDKAVRAAKTLLFEHVALAIVDAFRTEILESEEPAPRSVLAGLVDRLSRAAGSGERWDLERLKKALRDDDEDWQKLRAVFSRISKSVESVARGF
ncbi:MAG: hypothetical protein NZM33_16805 [Bryobacteraceae bacterium]|nr:hypothetical protein [Bryobacteraceae bacterium]